MKVILKTEIDSLGMEGDVVNVAKGYGRNYLIPQGFALEANNQNIKFMASQKKKIDARRLKAQEAAEKISESLKAIVVNIRQKVGEGDKLYGSVTGMDIAEQMEKQGVTIDRKKLTLEKPIKSLGEFEVPVKLHPNVTGSIKVVVSPEE